MNHMFPEAGLHGVNRYWNTERLPRIDCQKCGYPNCLAFTMKLLAKEESLELCRGLQNQQRNCFGKMALRKQKYKEPYPGFFLWTASALPMFRQSPYVLTLSQSPFMAPECLLSSEPEVDFCSAGEPSLTLTSESSPVFNSPTAQPPIQSFLSLASDFIVALFWLSVNIYFCLSGGFVLFDDNSAERTGIDDVPVFSINKLFEIYEPCFFISHLKK